MYNKASCAGGVPATYQRVNGAYFFIGRYKTSFLCYDYNAKMIK